MTRLRVLDPGFRSTVQDRGRMAHLRRAVPPSGPADPIAFEAAQRLVGNTADEAAIEIIGPPFRCALDAPRLVCATGREVSLRTRGLVDGWTAVFARAGEEIVVEGTERTRFAYLAVSGAVAVEPVLGSRSTYLPAAIGPVPRPLAGGDELAIGEARRGSEGAGHQALWSYGTQVGVIRGPHADRIGGADRLLHGQVCRVSERSDRMGLRLEGADLEPTGEEILSFGVVAGAIQVPHGGDAIVLLADHQTTGGYPVIAKVLETQIGSVAQAAPGGPLSFYVVDREGALESLRAARGWLARL